MPLIATAYRPPLPFRNGHIATIYSGLLRKVAFFTQDRERITLPDGDFMDLDWSMAPSPTDKVAIILHGLEGNAQRAYMMGSALAFNTAGFDVCAVNLRSCSGEINRLYRSYHSGATEDLEAVLNHILEHRNYSELYLKGFSMGGNLILKYLGEDRKIPLALKAAVAVSVPCDLYSSLKQLLLPKNALYTKRFKKNLLGKLRAKQALFPERISDNDIRSIVTLKDFDDVYTSKAHGFTDALDYYERCSCLQYLPALKIPTLLINAKNDSFLGPECYPVRIAEKNDSLHLEIPAYGGHVGFFDRENRYYTEKRAIKFVQEAQ